MTEETKAEGKGIASLEALRSSLPAFLEDLDELVLIADRDGKIVYANPACLKSNGYGEAELIGQHVSLLRSAKDPGSLYSGLWETILNGNCWRGQLFNKRKNGTFYPVEAVVRPIGVGETTGIFYLSIQRDISEARHVRLAAEKQANLLGELSERVPGIFFQLQTMPRQRPVMSYASSSLESVFGYTLAEVAIDATVLLKGLSPEDRHSVKRSFLEAVRLFKEWTVEFRLSQEDQRDRWYHLAARPVQGEHQTVLWNGYINEITERKHSELELRQTVDFIRKQNQVLAHARHEAGQAVRAKSLFLARMSHEIRTPMNGILGAADLLMDSDLNAEQKECLEIVRSGGQALMHVINSILDYSKLEAEKVSLSEKNFSFHEVLEESVKILGPSARKAGLSMEVVDESDPELLVTGDPHLIRQVLLNIGGNAIKFTLEGTIRFMVEVEREDSREITFRCSIRDSGIGIPKSKMETIFEPFTQVDESHTRHFGGSGLGLAISKQLVETMNGKIWVESRMGKGSCFWIVLTLPKVTAKAEARTADAGDRVERRRRGDGNGGHRRSLMIADDEPNNLRVMEILLTRRGFNVVTAKNGKEVLERLSEHEPDLIFMDCQMPVMDGFEVTRLIRQGKAGSAFVAIPIVAITALAMEGDSDRCIEAGMNDFIPKPVGKQDLERVIDHWLKVN